MEFVLWFDAQECGLPSDIPRSLPHVNAVADIAPKSHIDLGLDRLVLSCRQLLTNPKVKSANNFASFSMSDDSLKSTEVSGSHSLRTGLSTEDIKQAFLDNLFYLMGRVPAVATKNDLYTALAVTVRDRAFRASVHTFENYLERKPRVVAYLGIASL